MFFIILKIYCSVKSDVLMEAPSRSAELLIFDLEPLTHRTVGLISEKLNLALIQYIIVLYGLCHLSDRCLANPLRNCFCLIANQAIHRKAEQGKTDMLLLTCVSVADPGKCNGSANFIS